MERDCWYHRAIAIKRCDFCFKPLCYQCNQVHNCPVRCDACKLKYNIESTCVLNKICPICIHLWGIPSLQVFYDIGSHIICNNLDQTLQDRLHVRSEITVISNNKKKISYKRLSGDFLLKFQWEIGRKAKLGVFIFLIISNRINKMLSGIISLINQLNITIFVSDHSLSDIRQVLPINKEQENPVLSELKMLSQTGIILVSLKKLKNVLVGYTKEQISDMVNTCCNNREVILYQFNYPQEGPCYLVALRFNTCLLYTSPSPRDS